LYLKSLYSEDVKVKVVIGGKVKIRDLEGEYPIVECDERHHLLAVRLPWSPRLYWFKAEDAESANVW